MKSHEKKELEKLEELRKTIESSPLTTQIIAEKAAANMAIRREAAMKIDALMKERETAIPKLQADLEAKERKYQTAKTALDIAADEYNHARQGLSSESNAFDSQIRNHEAILVETADPALDEAMQFFNDKLSFLRSPGRISRTVIGAERNIFTWTKETHVESNLPAVRDALAFCQAAIRELERLKLSPEVDLEMIERMKAAIPDIDVYSEIDGEKDLERGTDPTQTLARLASDSLSDWSMKKLDEKFLKVMGRSH
jgi:multidrug efflux pump subunit AcrA (membrane-fusion protein)